ncbi:MAG: sigma 54-interacting transcriptional regulator [Deltaproteobacteria bacterium]|nr:sigma 54-interacting transcriptional regulator [Deltaproteobacteria bacterium]
MTCSNSGLCLDRNLGRGRSVEIGPLWIFPSGVCGDVLGEENTPPEDNTTPDERPERNAGPPSVLLVDEDGASVHPLPARGTLTIGRGEGCDLKVEHASVSRTHAVLEVDGRRLTIRDAGSVNGVRLRGRRLDPNEAQVFGVGEVVELGRASMVVIAQRLSTLAEAAAAKPLDVGGAVVAHPSMRALYALVERVAMSDINALVLGETGVGKELLVEALHRGSRRASQPLVRLNCAALSPTLVESELFGYEKGAFTGALSARAGLLEAAHGGTLFLDEVGDLPAALQAKILRVIEDRQVLRVGAQRTREVDVRFVAATHRDLRAEVQLGTFRRDLYYRLNGIVLAIPPLRERVAEVRPLAEHFLAKARPGVRGGPLDPAVVAVLEAHDWPGNVRELRNVIGRAVILAGDGPITLAELPEELRLRASRPPSDAPKLRDEMGAIERRRIEDALARTNGNQTHAAVLLGMPRRTLVARLKQYGLGRSQRREEP